MRGLRPWNQFDRYTRDVAQRKGSRLRAAQLRDPRYLAELEQAVKSNGAGELPRPTLEEWTPEVEAMYAVANDLRMLFRAITKSGIASYPGPEGPGDIIAARKKQVSLSKVYEQIN